MLFAERIDDAHHVLAILALRDCHADGGALHFQRLARTRHFHVLITAKRCHGPVDAGQSILCGGDREVAALDQVMQMRRVIRQDLAIYLPCILESWSVV